MCNFEASRYERFFERPWLSDEPGERLFLQLKEVLPNLERHQLPPGCKDFSEYYMSCH